MRFESLYAKIHPEPNTGCWLWAGAHSANGYGYVRDGAKVKNVHRVVYAIEREPIPEGMSLDHLCRNPACVNPDHLEVVTHKENLRRGVGALVSSYRMRGNKLAIWREKLKAARERRKRFFERNKHGRFSHRPGQKTRV